MTVCTAETQANSTPAPASGDDAFDIRTLGQRLDRLVRDNATEQAATHDLVQLVGRLTGAMAVLYYTDDSTGQLAAEPEVMQPQEIAGSALDQLFALASRAQSEASLQVAQSGGASVSESSQTVALATPIWRRDGGVEVLVILAPGSSDDRRRLAGWVQILQFLAAFAGQWRGNFGDGDQVGYAAPGRLIQAIGTASDKASLPEAVKVYANLMRDQLDAVYVAIGYRARGGTCRLAAMSDPYQFERGAPLASWIETSLAEALIEPEDGAIGSVGRETQAIQELRLLSGVQNIYRLPFTGVDGNAVGACLVVSERALQDSEINRWKQTCDVAGPQLGMLRRARSSRIDQARKWLRNLTETRRRALYTSILLTLTFFFAVPLPHRLRCGCEIQPATRRYVAAPYEGRLDVAFVEPGDVVAAGQILARMEGREIETEISGIEAALSAATQERQVAMSEGDAAAARISAAQMKTLEVKLSLYRDRLKNLEIASPTDGVVISGDPKKLEGSRLRMGQTLVEVGPLDKMFLEVEISDEDIARAEKGRDVSFRLSATPLRSFHGRLVRIHPRAEQRDGKNIFIGDVEIDDRDDLRPGMRGHARIASAPRPLAWKIFHRAVEQIVFWLGA